jgi:hypothetical protein
MRYVHKLLRASTLNPRRRKRREARSSTNLYAPVLKRVKVAEAKR